jgi:hypothetical protein
MSSFSATDITLLSGALIGGISSLILVIQRSTCTTIKCCGAECERKVRTLEELEAGAPPDISVHVPPDIPALPVLPVRNSDIEKMLSSTVRDRVSDLERRSTS